MSWTNQQGMVQMNNTAQVCMDIDSWIQDLPATFSSWPKIFQMPPYLRNLNEKAYEPKLVSIGPYHCQKDHLKAMEAHKGRFLKDLLRRTNQNSAQRYEEAMKGMMERARCYYAESLVVSYEEFFKMMVVDGCFIVELFFKLINERFNDSILNVDHQIRFHILADLTLVENQLPFFVLWEFLGIAFPDERTSYINSIINLFKEVMPGLKDCRSSYDERLIRDIKHLLQLLCSNWISSVGSMREAECEPGQNYAKWEFIRSATKLRGAGIKFSKGNKDNLFDIKFEKGTLYIPPVNFQPQTEALYFNIIAYEQFDDSGSRKYLTEYITVLDFLIDTEKDVELLCQTGIMCHWLGTNEAAARMFNRLGNKLQLNGRRFPYGELFNNINKYYKQPWHRPFAILRQKYLNNPWAYISFFAAAFLLLLTLLQTVFAIFPRS
ncbi:hypothetical protein SLA2020_209940 [Shorea laevis]